MAHVGKFYKLHFRRDLCINCVQHRRSLPEARTIDCRFSTVSVPTTEYHIDRALARPVVGTERELPEYETLPLTMHGRTFTVRLSTVLDVLGDNETKLLWQFYSAGIVVMHFTARPQFSGRCDAYKHDQFSDGPPITDDPEFWGGFQINGNFNSSFANWEEWPEAESP